ncbi:monovalent cation/H(+) antiporter subunit G [uncultured Tateyamaria sp.]|uniref:monovalent cation/H(+) antiporter subunit G n=1 Tax=Tateyamaria sp. 1078 TaxID=3417464 RepID=UPI002623B1D5|nr:monovalent cation/H(+) antiporter subunit G [uncultured Tateyamaria sp.]
MTSETLLLYGATLALMIGSAFVIVGVLGLMKFNDPMTRLHAPTKVGTLGIGMLLLASMLKSMAAGDASIHELLIMSFLFVTTPISAHFIAKVGIHLRACDTPPSPTQDDTWSTLTTPQKNQQSAV